MIAGPALCAVAATSIWWAWARPVSTPKKLAFVAIAISSASAGAAYIVVDIGASPGIAIVVSILLGVVALCEASFLTRFEWSRFVGPGRRTQRMARLLLYALNVSIFGLLVSIIFGVSLAGTTSSAESIAAIAAGMGLVAAVPPPAQTGLSNLKASSASAIVAGSAGLAVAASLLGGIDPFRSTCLALTAILLGIAFASAASSAPEADQIATPRYMIIQIVLASLCITVVFAGLALRLLLLHL